MKNYKKILLTSILMLAGMQVSVAEITNDNATMTMLVPLSATLSKLDNITLTSVDAINYTGSDTYTLVSNGQVRVSATTTDLVNGTSTVTPTISLDSSGTVYDTSAGVAHDDGLHTLDVAAVVSTADIGGTYSGVVTLTVSAI